MDDSIDPEKLAAFLDGTLDDAGREEVLRIIASSPAAYEAFADAAAVLADPSANRRSFGGPGTMTPARRFLPYAWVACLGAATAGVLFLIPILRANAPFDASAAASAIVANAGSEPDFVSASDSTAIVWANWRGDHADADALAFEAGARALDLEVALAAHDTVAYAESRARLGTLADDVLGGEALAQQYRSLGQAAGRAHIARLRSDLREVMLAAAWFDLGGWYEAARLSLALGIEPSFDPEGRALRAIRRRFGRSDERADLVLPPIRVLQDVLKDGIEPSERDAFETSLLAIREFAAR